MNINYIIAGICGFVGGGLFGGMIMGRRAAAESAIALEKAMHHSDLLEQELTELREKHKKALDRINKELDSSLEDLRKDISKPKPQIEKLMEKYRVMEEETEEENQDPFLIEDYEYGIDSETASFSYYPEDNVFVDDRDEILRVPEFLFGEKALEEIQGTEANAVYIHNPKLGTDYEVTIEHGLSYSRDIQEYEEYQ